MSTGLTRPNVLENLDQVLLVLDEVLESVVAL